MTLLGRIFGVRFGGDDLFDKYKERRVSKVNIEVRHSITYGESGFPPAPYFSTLIHEVERINGKPSLFPDIYCDGPFGDATFETRDFLYATAIDNTKSLVDYFRRTIGIDVKLIGDIDADDIEWIEKKHTK